jgi:hypothetical protein
LRSPLHSTRTEPALRAANCAAAGFLSNFTSNIVDYTVQGPAAAMPDCKRSRQQLTAGAVIEPHFIPGLQITTDYISISIANEIATPDQQT